MPSSGGPNTINDSIVFNYDTSDLANSWRGKPTTNILTGIGYTYGNQNQTYFKSTYDTELSYIPTLGGYVSTDYCIFYNDYPGGSGNCCPSVFSFGGFSVSPSTIYTYQIIYRTPDGYANPNYMYHYEFGPSGYITEYGLWDGSRTQDLGGGWTHAWGTFTSNASANYFNCYLFHYQYTWTKIQIAGVMLTQGNNIIPPRQFLRPLASRSNTNALLDLSSRPNTANIANVSLDSNAQIVFDGVNDNIVISQNNEFFSNYWTWEMVVKYNSNTGTYQGLVWAEGDTGNGSGLQYLLTLYNNSYFHYRINNAATGWANTDTSTINFTPTNYNHIVWQFDGGGTTNIYINGSLFHTNSSRGTYTGGTNSPIFIGTRNDAAYASPMNMALLKFYNRFLSSTEIRNNYNEYKTRFNLP